MRAIAAVDQAAGSTIIKKYTVGRQPAAFKDSHAVRQFQTAHTPNTQKCKSAGTAQLSSQDLSDIRFRQIVSELNVFGALVAR